MLTLGEIDSFQPHWHKTLRFTSLWLRQVSWGQRLEMRHLLVELLPIFLHKESWIYKWLPTTSLYTLGSYWLYWLHDLVFSCPTGWLMQFITEQPVWVGRPNAQCEIQGIFMHQCFTFFSWHHRQQNAPVLRWESYKRSNWNLLAYLNKCLWTISPIILQALHMARGAENVVLFKILLGIAVT